MQLLTSPTHIYSVSHTADTSGSRYVLSFTQKYSIHYLGPDAAGERAEFLSLSSYQDWKHPQLKSQILPEVYFGSFLLGCFFNSGVTHSSA